MKNFVEIAQEIATKAHAGQTRWDKVTPYITHPRAVAEALVDQDHNDEAIAAAWLHDVVEDTAVTIQDLRDAGIPSLVVEAVRLLTKHKGQPYLDYILRVKRNPLATVVKVADIKHNLSCFDRPSGSLYEKYQLALYILTGETYPE